MIAKGIFVDIHVRFKQGQSVRRIAFELGLSRNTVARHLKSYAMPNYANREQRPTKLGPFKAYLLNRIESAKPDWLPATVLFHEVRQQGYQGGIAQLRRFVRQYKSMVAQKPIIRFETAPGEQMQIDFTTIRRGKNPLKAFVAVLGYSRVAFVKFFDNERAQSWQQGLQEAFDYFGGVPKQVLCDNAKALIVKRNAYAEGEHQLHVEMLQLAKDYGFKLSACQPYRAQTKGKVERFNHYLKNSFAAPLRAELRVDNLELDAQIANAKIGPWLQQVAHQRQHGTILEKPIDRWAKEVEQLQPLPRIVAQSPQTSGKADIPIVPPCTVTNLQHDIDIYQRLLEVDSVTA